MDGAVYACNVGATRKPGVRDDGQGLAQQRLQPKGPAQTAEGRGRDVVLARDLPIVRQRLHQEVPSVKALRSLALGAKIFRRVDPRLDRSDDRLGDLVLHREDV